MKILVSCLLAAAVSCCAAQSTPEANDLDKTLTACGKPDKDVARKDRLGGGKDQYTFDMRDLTYGNVVLEFEDTVPDSWVLFGVRSPGHKLVYGTAALPQARKLLPCLPDLNAGLKASAFPAAPMPSSDRSEYGFMILVLGCIGVIVVAAVYGRSRLWAKRPRRLCVACNAVTQPSRTSGGSLYCPVCDAANPIPLASLAAVEYFAKRSVVAPDR